jgi:hypothetical protein
MFVSLKWEVENHKRSSAICNSMQFQMSFCWNHIKNLMQVNILPATFKTLKIKDIISSVKILRRKLLIEIISSKANRLKRRNPLIYIFLIIKMLRREVLKVYFFFLQNYIFYWQIGIKIFQTYHDRHSTLCNVSHHQQHFITL